MSKARAALLCGVFLLVARPVEAALSPGDIAPDFTVPDYHTAQPVHLRDFAGQIVLLDFFAYWCPHCQASSPIVQTQIQDYYAARGGNPAGIPVQLVSLALVNNRAGNDAFIANAGLDLVLDDSARAAFNVYGYGYVPMFVLVNGVAGANYDQWEVLYSEAGFSAGDEAMFRGLIDGVVHLPEPSAVLMLLAGAVGLSCRRRSAIRVLVTRDDPRNDPPVV